MPISYYESSFLHVDNINGEVGRLVAFIWDSMKDAKCSNEVPQICTAICQMAARNGNNTAFSYFLFIANWVGIFTH